MAQSAPTLVYQTRESETITGCVVGHVTSAARREILFTCYSGVVKSLVDRKQARKLGATTEDTSQLTEVQIKQEKTAKADHLQDEIAKLEQKLALEEQKVQSLVQKQKQLPRQASQQPASAAAQGSGQAQLATKGFKVDYRMNLVSQQAAYELTITSQRPIETILL